MTQIENRKEITGQDKEKVLKRGFLFACTNKSEGECLGRSLFATEKFYGPVVIRIRKGDILFLNNIDTDVLYGAFKAVSDGGLDIEKSAFNGRYRYQVKVEPLGGTIDLGKARRVLDKFGLKRNSPVFKEKLLGLLDTFKSEAQKIDLLNC